MQVQLNRPERSAKILSVSSIPTLPSFLTEAGIRSLAQPVARPRDFSPGCDRFRQKTSLF